MVSRALCGMLLMAATGLCVTGDMVTSKLIEKAHWPYWYLVVASSLLAAVFNGMAVYCFKMELPSRSDLKWVISRSVFEDLHWILAVIAVLIGASPGDVAALTSVDIIAAALFGRVFLREELGIWHFIALVLSATGAICIAQPEFIFGLSEGRQQSPLGYFLALLSGCFQAASFVCARKSAHLSVGVLTFSSLVFAVPMALMPALLPMGPKPTWEPVLANPGIALGLLTMLSMWTMAAIGLPAAGATRCPAAVSATVFTTACMVSGYISQIVFFSEVPKVLTLLGAACMLLSVIIMALPSTESEPEPSDDTEAPKAASEVPGEASETSDTQEPQTETVEADDETMSLGSFVASEVSFCSSHVRRRTRRFTKPKVLPWAIGAICA